MTTEALLLCLAGRPHHPARRRLPPACSSSAASSSSDPGHSPPPACASPDRIGPYSPALASPRSSPRQGSSSRRPHAGSARLPCRICTDSARDLAAPPLNLLPVAVEVPSVLLSIGYHGASSRSLCPPLQRLAQLHRAAAASLTPPRGLVCAPLLAAPAVGLLPTTDYRPTTDGLLKPVRFHQQMGQEMDRESSSARKFALTLRGHTHCQSASLVNWSEKKY